MERLKASVAVGIVVMATSVCAPSAALAALSAEEIEARCEPLAEAARTNLVARINKGAIEASTITGGGDLSEVSCIDQFDGMSFDFFSMIPSLDGALMGALSSIKQQFADALNQMVCNVADDIRNNVDTFLSCSASLSVSLNAAAGIAVPDLDSCLGAGQTFGIDFGATESVGTGSNSISVADQYSMGTGTSYSGNGTAASAISGAAAGASVVDAVQRKVDSLLQARGR